MSDPLKIERRGTALWLVIDRPERRNALNDEVFAALKSAVAQSQSDDTIRSLVITGSGDRAFCSGADLSTDRSAFARELAQPRHAGADAFRTILEHPKPVIACINGACMAGGMALLAVADIAIAAEEAKFGLPEVKVGVFPMIVSALLMHRLGIADRDLCELSMIGEPIDAARALEMKLISRVVPRSELEEQTARIAEALADRSPTALRLGKAALGRMRSMAPDAALAYAEAQIRILGLSEDAQEGVRAFSEKRAPNWTGR